MPRPTWFDYLIYRLFYWRWNPLMQKNLHLRQYFVDAWNFTQLFVPGPQLRMEFHATPPAEQPLTEELLEPHGFVPAWDLGYLSKRRGYGYPRGDGQPTLWIFPPCGDLDWHMQVGRALGPMIFSGTPVACPRTVGQLRDMVRAIDLVYAPFSRASGGDCCGTNGDPGESCSAAAAG